MGLNSPGKICLMTETHLHAKTHLNSEITKFAHDYHLTRADRNREYDLNDQDQLASHGGSMILTSPELITERKIEYSNGNCELAVAEIPELKLATISLYRPPIPNFSLRKFRDVLNKLETYLSDLRERKPDFKIAFGGTLIFPRECCNGLRASMVFIQIQNQVTLMRRLHSEYMLTSQLNLI